MARSRLHRSTGPHRGDHGPGGEPHRRRRARGSGDRGVTIVLVALMMSIILLFVALVLDGGQAYLSHRQSQNASDTGAYAGVRALDHLKYDPTCNPTIVAGCPFTNTAAVAQAVINEAGATGADTATLHCYLTTSDGTRVVDPNSGTARDLCAGGVATAANVQELSLAFGVESDATVNSQTSFAKVATSSFSQLTASTTATAVIQSFADTGQGSPFIVCGSSVDSPQPGGGYYDLLNKTTNADGTVTYTVKPGAEQRFYILEASQVPNCGGASSSFDGLSGGEPITLDQLNASGPGNGNNGSIHEDIVGITPCTPAQVAAGTYDGCGLLIPISAYNQGSGSNLQSYVVAWTVWMVWGDGTGSYRFNQIPTNPPPAGVGNSCKSPNLGVGGQTAGMKYCGELISGYNLVGQGGGSGPPLPGQPRVIHLIN